MLFGLIVLGGVAVFVGYRVFGIVVACGAVALLITLVSIVASKSLFLVARRNHERDAASGKSFHRPGWEG
jgi:hypothetical protein